MFRSLYSKLAAVLTGLFCLVGLSFVAVIMFSTDMYQQEVNQRLNRHVADHIVSEKPLIRDKRVNKEALQELFHMLMVINPSIEIYLLDPEGNILAYSAPQGKVKLKRVDLAPVKKWLAGGAKIPLVGDDPRHLEGKKVFTAARIPKEGELQGYLYVILGGEIYDSVEQKLKRSYVLHLSGWMIFASLLFAFGAGLVLFALLTGRLKRLAAAMDAFKRGDALKGIDVPVRRDGPVADEIDRLGATFREMTAQIKDQMEELRKSDAVRRELVANVSHDLRTPLATLQGYLETLLLKEGHLEARDRKHYLEAAIKHCKRLSKLVDELLELAKLDSYEIRVERESFNLCELLQDVVQKFQLRAREKGIKILTDLKNELPFVYADIGLIERVLENLFENAITHTPDGGTIRVVLLPQEENVEIRIRDTGQGIPQEELPYIFNRFYQLDKSRKGELGHSGLGLAITKRILELHGRSISVASALNIGTTFRFQLPLHRPA